VRHLITNPYALQYLDEFRKDFATRNQAARTTQFYGEKILINPGVFPSDSTYSFSTQSILSSVSADHRRGDLLDIASVCDVGTGCGVFLCVLRRLFESAYFVGLEIDPNARYNAALNLITSHNLNYSLLISDLFAATDEKFDLVITSLPFVCDLRYGNEIDVNTLARFWEQVEDRLTDRGRVYINWASWADFSLFETIAEGTSLKRLRVDDFPNVVQDFSWKTYVFTR
jgi:methylase of polypeptide subunit release factors